MCENCKRREARKRYQKMCEHKLVDVWADARAPIATEVTQEEGKSLVAEMPSTRYLQCADPKCGLEIEDDVE
jgi:hypothetical protein